MSKKTDESRRNLLSSGAKVALAGAAASALGVANAADNKKKKNDYAEPKAYGLKRKPVILDKKHAALVVIDPQIDFLSPKGISWPVVGESVTENNTVENLEKLFKAAKNADLPVVVSPHFYYPEDHHWHFGASGEHFMHDSGMFARPSAFDMTGFEGSGADFMPQYKPYIYDGKTIIASPHKIFGPETNDVVLQLRKQHVDQIILSGMAANLCVESHMREFIEQGFEVIVVKDATAGPRVPEGDGYQAALTNYRLIANDLWTTEQTVKALS